jgi:hypothetical protein
MPAPSVSPEPDILIAATISLVVTADRMIASIEGLTGEPIDIEITGNDYIANDLPRLAGLAATHIELLFTIANELRANKAKVAENLETVTSLKAKLSAATSAGGVHPASIALADANAALIAGFGQNALKTLSVPEDSDSELEIEWTFADRRWYVWISPDGSLWAGIPSLKHRYEHFECVGVADFPGGFADFALWVFENEASGPRPRLSEADLALVREVLAR